MLYIVSCYLFHVPRFFSFPHKRDVIISFAIFAILCGSTDEGSRLYHAVYMKLIEGFTGP